jgi:hypothetical protein
VQPPLVVEDDGPAGAGAIHRRPGVGQPVGDVDDRRVLEVVGVDRGDGEALEPPVGTDEVRHEVVGGAAEQLRGRGVLLHVPALAHDRDPVADPDGLLDVVGDEDDRLPHCRLQAQELRLQPLADDRVDGRERLVHQEHGGVAGEGARHPGPLALPAGELMRVAVPVHGGVEAHQREQFLDAGPGAGTIPAEQAGHGAHVGADGLVREEPDVLDDVADAAAQLDRVDPRDVVLAQQDPPGGGLDDPVDHLHRRRLAAPGRADEHRQLPGGEGEVELGHPDSAVRVRLADALEPDLLGAAEGCGGGGVSTSVHAVTFLGRARC